MRKYVWFSCRELAAAAVVLFIGAAACSSQPLCEALPENCASHNDTSDTSSTSTEEPGDGDGEPGDGDGEPGDGDGEPGDGDGEPGDGDGDNCPIASLGCPCTMGGSCDEELSCVDGVCVQSSTCGNGVLDLGEECDDGNATNDDGCHSTCISDIRALGPRYRHTCALLASGLIRCWGHNEFGQLGQNHTVDIGDDELPTPLNSTIDLETMAIALSGTHYSNCAIVTGGTLRCWGYNYYGQLGQGHTNHIGDDEDLSPANTTVTFSAAIVGLSGGYDHICALLDDGGVRCWGVNGFGRLGLGHTQWIGDNEPVDDENSTVALGAKAVEVSAGGHFTCALMESGSVRCWGRNDFGQLGLGHVQAIGDNESLSPQNSTVTLGDVTVVQLTTGANHACALLDDGVLRCWGYNASGQLGAGHTNNLGAISPLTSINTFVPLNGEIVDIQAGGDHTCALMESGDLHCWGRSQLGQLGLGTIESIGDDEVITVDNTHVEFGELRVEAIWVGAEHNCAMLEDTSIRCWGANMSGQLGYGHVNSIGDDEPALLAPALSVF